MNIEELPAFLNRYNEVRAKKSGDFIRFSFEFEDSTYPEPFCLVYINICCDERTEHTAPTFAALLEKMKKDIDGLT